MHMANIKLNFSNTEHSRMRLCGSLLERHRCNTSIIIIIIKPSHSHTLCSSLVPTKHFQWNYSWLSIVITISNLYLMNRPADHILTTQSHDPVANCQQQETLKSTKLKIFREFNQLDQKYLLWSATYSEIRSLVLCWQEGIILQMKVTVGARLVWYI